MKTKTRPVSTILVGLLVLPLHSGSATVLVNDTWQDGNRTNQEAGTDADLDGDIESAWFGTTGTLASSTGKLAGSVGTGSSSWTTYFAAEGSEVALALGETLTVTWNFSLTGTNATNASQGFRLALVNTPAAARLAADGNPGSAAYGGYGMFMNMGQTIDHTNPFQLMERADAATASALLSASGSWASRDDQETTGTIGYADDVSYSFLMTIARTGTSELTINASMSGGSLGGDGMMMASFIDTTPNSLAFDTFSLRPASEALSATTFNMTSFSVAVVPEPSSFMVYSCAALGLLRRQRR